MENDRQDLVDTASLRPLVDGIYAIVLTLLVIELRLPQRVEAGKLGHDLAEIRWEVAAFAFAFLWLLASWLSNRELYERLRFVRHSDMLLLLMPVMALCLIPLATSALAKSVHDEANLGLATQFFGALIGGTNLLESINYYIFGRARLLGLEAGSERHVVRRLLARYVLPYPLVLLLAAWMPWVALLVMSLDLLLALVPSLGVQRLLSAWLPSTLRA